MSTKPQTVTEKIHYMEEFIDLNKFLTENHNDPEQIIAYFKENHSRYRHIYNRKGNMHFIVSKDGETFSYDDMFYQPDVAISYAKPGGKVLELGAQVRMIEDPHLGLHELLDQYQDGLE